MIHFSEKLGESKTYELPLMKNFKDIRSSNTSATDEVKEYWDSVFSEVTPSDDILFTDEEIISEVFERSESDFKFDFDIDDEITQEQIAKFDVENWNKLDESQKVEVIEDFISHLCEKMGIEEKPNLVFFEDNENVCGAYNNQTNTMELNRNILNNPNEVLNTVAHEARHAYQYQRACIGETREDVLYAINFLNYIEPILIGDKYVNYNEYQNQLLEAEARAFAKNFCC